LRPFGQVQTKFWDGASSVKGLSDGAKLLALYLLTCPHHNSLGCFGLPMGYIAGDTGWQPQVIRRRLAELEGEGFAFYDEAAGWVIMPSYLKHNPAKNRDHMKGIIALAERVPERFGHYGKMVEALTAYARHAQNGMDTVLEGFRDRIDTVPTQCRDSVDIKERERERRENPPPTPPQGGVSVVEEVFEHWKAVHRCPRAELTPGRREAVASRLKAGYSAERLKLAVEGCRASPFHMGENDRNTVYNDLASHIMHPKKIDSLINLGERERAKKEAAASERERAMAERERFEAERSSARGEPPEGFSELRRGAPKGADGEA
jgi:hypothetical protein